MTKPLVGVIMGSDSDLDIMQGAIDVLKDFDIACEVKIVSAHRTPDLMGQYAESAKSRGLKVIIAGAGGSAHLPGMTASETSLPVIAVPVRREHHGHEAFWSNIKMPPGVPLATMPENGAKNAALFAIRIIGISDEDVARRYDSFVKKQHDEIFAKNQQIDRSGWESLLT